MNGSNPILIGEMVTKLQEFARVFRLRNHYANGCLSLACPFLGAYL